MTPAYSFWQDIIEVRCGCTNPMYTDVTTDTPPEVQLAVQPLDICHQTAALDLQQFVRVGSTQYLVTTHRQWR